MLSALLAMIFYGVWAFFPKLAVSYMSPQSALVYVVAGAALVGVVVLVLIKFHIEHHPEGIVYALLTGIAGMTGTFFSFPPHRAAKSPLLSE